MSGEARRYSLKSIIWFTVIGFVVVSALTVAFGPRLTGEFYPLPEDQGSAWYFWQVAEFEALGRIAVWLGYGLHQIAVWWIFLSARRARIRARAQSAGGQAIPDGPFVKPGHETGDRYTLLMVIVNFGFVMLHLLQTHLWYGGLAQDVPIWTSQGSVIVMLVILLVLEMPRRGLFWGRWRTVPEGLHRLLRRWHGMFISWALVYTFWFHPMEGNWGLMSGFVYMFLLFAQMNLFGSKPHKNRTWVVVLESFVLVHGTLISLYKYLEAWPLFYFGFFAMIIITYMHTWKLQAWASASVIAVYLGTLVWIYWAIRGWNLVFEITFIPVALYGGAVGLWLLGTIAERLGGGTKALAAPPSR